MINEGMETEADLSMEAINVGAVIMDAGKSLGFNRIKGEFEGLYDPTD